MLELVQAALALAAVTCAPATAPAERVPSGPTPAVVASQQRHDPWLGHDKFTHAGASWAATTFVFGAGRAAGLSTDDALLIAVPAALAMGVAKELADRRSSFFSARDLIADFIGTAAAYFFLREVR